MKYPFSLWLSSMLHKTTSDFVFQNNSRTHKKIIPQSCPTLWDPMDCSLPGSFVHGISQATILEQVAISFSRGSTRPKDWTHYPMVSTLPSSLPSVPPETENSSIKWKVWGTGYLHGIHWKVHRVEVRK